MPSWQTQELLLDFALPALLLMCGILLIHSALKKFRPLKPAPRCFKCNYDMRAASSLTCPECGFTHKSQRQLHRGKPRYIRLILASLLILPTLTPLYFTLFIYPWAYPREAAFQEVNNWRNKDHWRSQTYDFKFLTPPTLVPNTPPGPIARALLSVTWAAWGIDPLATWPQTTASWENGKRPTLSDQQDDQLSLERLSLEDLSWARENAPWGYAVNRYLIHQFTNPADHYARHVAQALYSHELFFMSETSTSLTPSSTNASTLFPALRGIQTVTIGSGTPDDDIIQGIAGIQGLQTLKFTCIAFTPQQLTRLSQNPSLTTIHCAIDFQCKGNVNTYLTAFASFSHLRKFFIDSAYTQNGKPAKVPPYTLSDHALAAILANPSLEQTNIDSTIDINHFPLAIAALKTRLTPVKCQLVILGDPSQTGALRDLTRHSGLSIVDRSTPGNPSQEKPATPIQ